MVANNQTTNTAKLDEICLSYILLKKGNRLYKRLYYQTTIKAFECDFCKGYNKKCSEYISPKDKKYR